MVKFLVMLRQNKLVRGSLASIDALYISGIRMCNKKIKKVLDDSPPPFNVSTQPCKQVKQKSLSQVNPSTPQRLM